MTCRTVTYYFNNYRLCEKTSNQRVWMRCCLVAITTWAVTRWAPDLLGSGTTLLHPLCLTTSNLSPTRWVTKWIIIDIDFKITLLFRFANFNYRLIKCFQKVDIAVYFTNPMQYNIESSKHKLTNNYTIKNNLNLLNARLELSNIAFLVV